MSQLHIIGEIIGVPTGTLIKVLVNRSNVKDLIGQIVKVRLDYVEVPKPIIGEHTTILADFSDEPGVLQADQIHLEVATDDKAIRNQLFALAGMKKWPKRLAPDLLEHFQRGGVTNIADWLSSSVYDYRIEQGRQEVNAFFDGILTERQVNDLLNYWKYSHLDRQLQLFGLTRSEIRAVTAHDKHVEVITKLKTNPYTVLELDLERADQIIRMYPWYYKSPPERKTGEIARFLQEHLNANHDMYVKIATLVKTFGPKLHLNELVGPDGGYGCYLDGSPSDPNARLYSKKARDVEQSLVEVFTRLLTSRDFPVPEIPLSPRQLFPEQWAAVQQAVSKPLSITTGGAGTGKTTLVGELGRQVQQRGDTYMIVSYTGKAVRELRKRTGLKAIKTIHSFLYDIDALKTTKVLIVDEASMAPTSLMAKVVTLSVMLKQLILVGDPQQLPPISWGRLMQPLLEVEQIPRCHLLDNHRTSNEADGQNTLIEQANRLVADTSMKYRLTPGGNFFWFDGGVAEIKKLLESLAAEGYSGWECTVIVPYRKLAVELNEICQDLFNGANVNQRVHDGIRWRVGDRIMLLKNIKSLDVMNGEEGEIVAITDEGLMIKFTDDELLFKWSGSSGTDEGIEDDEFVATTPTTKLLQHSWALTCHKAQGSEWPIVIGYVPWASNFITRRLMYVMMTRAMKWFFLFGDQYTISQSINNVPPFGNCALAEQLEQPPAYGDVGDAGDTLNNFILQPRDTDMVNSTPE